MFLVLKQIKNNVHNYWLLWHQQRTVQFTSQLELLKKITVDKYFGQQISNRYLIPTCEDLEIILLKANLRIVRNLYMIQVLCLVIIRIQDKRIQPQQLNVYNKQKVRRFLWNSTQKIKYKIYYTIVKLLIIICIKIETFDTGPTKLHDIINYLAKFRYKYKYVSLAAFGLSSLIIKILDQESITKLTTIFFNGHKNLSAI